MPVADKRSALLVATGRYEDPKLPPLRGPTLDARNLERVLGDPMIGGFEVEVAEDASVQQLRVRLDDFFRSRAQHDLLLLHFSCHGLKDDSGRLYFAAADTELDYLFSTGISDKWLQELIEESRSQRIVMFLDCCFGGAFATAMARRAAGTENVGIKERFDGKGRLVLTSSTATQYAFEGGELRGEPQPSIFTKAIVQGLETGDADRDQDGRVSIDELYDYAVEALRGQDLKQTPTKAGYVEGDLYLAWNPRRRDDGAAIDDAGQTRSLNLERPPPESTSGQEVRSRVLKEGDTLESMAYAEYGDVTLWRALATFNNVDDPLRLQVGSNLLILPVGQARMLA